MNEFAAFQQGQALAAVGEAITAANAAGDGALAGKLATAYYFIANLG